MNRYLPWHWKYIAVSVGIIIIATIGTGISYVKQRVALEEWATARQAESDRKALAQLASESIAIRDRLGRAPNDLAELESLLGRPIPPYHNKGVTLTLDYYRKNSQEFSFKGYPYPGWLLRFESDNADAGWITEEGY